MKKESVEARNNLKQAIGRINHLERESENLIKALESGNQEVEMYKSKLDETLK